MTLHLSPSDAERLGLLPPATYLERALAIYRDHHGVAESARRVLAALDTAEHAAAAAASLVPAWRLSRGSVPSDLWDAIDAARADTMITLELASSPR